ncbi:MAG: hypothetical protein JNM84_27805 [Planctomycetes bacterium]|nr:hypothetical protein [Planctomycetota bacterium]
MLRASAYASLLLALAPLPAPAQRAIVGEHKLEPGILHPTIEEALVAPSRALVGFELGLHSSVPFVVTLTAGKREREFLIRSEPDVGISRLIVPGLVNAKLLYPGRKKRPVRFEISGSAGALSLASHGMSTGKVAGFELAFVDLDHDGALGTFGDGYVVKTPKQRQWTYGAGELDQRAMWQPLEIEGRSYWLEVDRGGFELVVSDREPEFRALREEVAKDALAELAALRKCLGFEALALDLALCAPCERHALYCAANGELALAEVQGQPQFSTAGAELAPRASLVYAANLREAVEHLEGSAFQRLRLLTPRATRIGCGFVRGVAVLDARGPGEEPSVAEFEPFAWPMDQARDVARTGLVGEVPPPIGEGERESGEPKLPGFPISVCFPSAAVTAVEAKLMVGERELEYYLTSPEHPGNEKLPENFSAILLLPTKPLPADAEVRVEVRCQYAGKPFEKRWSFRTRAE